MIKHRLLLVTITSALTIAALGVASGQRADAGNAVEPDDEDLFARYVLIRKTMPGTPSASSECYTDEDGVAEQRLVCSGEGHREAMPSTVMPLYRTYPHRLIEVAIAEIRRGILNGESDVIVNRARHHVHWKAGNADDIEIEETLSGVPGTPATPDNAIGRYRYRWEKETSMDSGFVRQRYENAYDGFEQQRIDAFGEGNEAIAFSDTLRLCRRFPPQLIEHAREQIAAGVLVGEHAESFGTIIHHVRWTAVPDTRFEIEETLLR